MEIELTLGCVAVIDDEDYELVRSYTWRTLRARKTCYAHTSLPRRNGSRPGLLMHRLITAAPLGFDVDHRNRNGLDNRRSNLRVCAHHENLCNQARTGGSSRYKGVSWDARMGKWRARIMNKSRERWIGYFASEREAAQAYDAVAVRVFGEFARTNFGKH